MSQTTPAPRTSETTSAVPTRTDVPGPNPAHRLARTAAPIVLLGGVLLLAVGMGLHLPSQPEEADVPAVIAAAPGSWLASHVAQSLGFAFLAIGTAMALPAIRRRRGATTTAVGILITVVGATMMSFGDAAHGAVGFALAGQVDPATSFAIQEAYFEHPAIMAFNLAPMVLSLGMILLGVGLLRSPGIPRWHGFLLVLAPIAVNVAFSFSLPTAVHGVPIVIGMTAFALAVFRGPRAGTGALARP